MAGRTRFARSVLVVDDEPDIRLLMTLVLRRSDSYEVVAEAATGAEAIKLATRHRPDVVLLDVSMPEMDGLKALPRILQTSPQSRVVMCSAFETVDASLWLGAVGCIDKDINLSNLVDQLTRILDAVEADGSRPGEQAE